MNNKLLIILHVYIVLFCACNINTSDKDKVCEKILNAGNNINFAYCDTCYTPAQARAYEVNLGSRPLTIREFEYLELFELYGIMGIIGPEKKDTIKWMREKPALLDYLCFIRKKTPNAYWYEIAAYQIVTFGKNKRDSAINNIAQKYFVRDRKFSFLFPNIIDVRDTGFNSKDWQKKFDYLECYGRNNYPDGKNYNTISPDGPGENIMAEKIYQTTKMHAWNNIQHKFFLSALTNYYIEDFGGEIKYPITEKDIAIYFNKFQREDTGYLRLFPDWKNVEPIIIKSVRKKK